MTPEMIELLDDYENGLLDETAMIQFFQELVRTGDAYKLQGFYGRKASELIQKGIINA